MKGTQAWPLAIAAVLAITVIANIALFMAANAPDAAQVEPDYYRRALAWDTTQVERARSAALGWRASARLVPESGRATGMVIELEDAAGRALTGARLETVAIHNLEAATPSRWTLAEVAPGRYRAAVTLHHPGRWELRVQASRGGDRFATVLHADLVAAPPTASAATEPAR